MSGFLTYARFLEGNVLSPPSKVLEPEILFLQLFKCADDLNVDKAQKSGFGALLKLGLRQASKGILEILQQFFQCSDILLLF